MNYIHKLRNNYQQINCVTTTSWHIFEHLILRDLKAITSVINAPLPSSISWCMLLPIRWRLLIEDGNISSPMLEMTRKKSLGSTKEVTIEICLVSKKNTMQFIYKKTFSQCGHTYKSKPAYRLIKELLVWTKYKHRVTSIRARWSQ